MKTFDLELRVQQIEASRQRLALHLVRGARAVGALTGSES